MATPALSEYPPYLTPDDFFKITGINKNTQAVWRCTRRHGLPFVKIGKSVRYNRDEIAAWFELHSVRPAVAV